MPLRIVTDSTADLSEQESAALGVTVVPLTVFFGDEALLDRVEITPPEFYDRLRSSKQLPKTSQPSAGRFREAYERLAAEGATEILSIQISSRLSGTINAARTAAADPPAGCRITVLDGMTVAGGLGAVVRRATEVASAGGTTEDAVEAVRAQIPRHQIHILLDTLEYLQKGGRIGRAKAWIGGILNVKPIVRLQDGEVAPDERVRSRARGLETLVNKVTAQPDVERIIVQHAASPADAERLAATLRERLPGVPIDIGWIGPVVGVYVGPGGVGAVTVQRPESR